jgi:hypothetical protein
MTKTEQLIEKLEHFVGKTVPGQKFASVEELQDSIPGRAGIGTVIRAVQQAQEMGLPIVTVRGPEGGYFHGSLENPAELVAVGDTVDLGALLAHAREIRRAVDDLIVRLEAAAA